MHSYVQTFKPGTGNKYVSEKKPHLRVIINFSLPNSAFVLYLEIENRYTGYYIDDSVFVNNKMRTYCR